MERFTISVQLPNLTIIALQSATSVSRLYNHHQDVRL